MEKTKIYDTLKETVRIEIKALQSLEQNIDEQFIEAVLLLFRTQGKIIFCGLGKCWHISNKIAATFSSTGTTAISLHPTEIGHGDFGVLQPKDSIVFLSKSGDTEETVNVALLTRQKFTTIAITSQKNSRLASYANITLNIPIEKEACPFNLAPTASTTAMLCLGDALAMALMKMKNFTKEDFKTFHPAGNIGKQLSLQVQDIMKTGVENPLLPENAHLDEILNAFSLGGSNAISIVNLQGELIGLITSFDIRKILNLHNTQSNLQEVTAADIMNLQPVTLEIDYLAAEALVFIRNHPLNPTAIPIISREGKPVGMLTLQALVKAGL